jgi:hypothetical protein
VETGETTTGPKWEAHADNYVSITPDGKFAVMPSQYKLEVVELSTGKRARPSITAPGNSIYRGAALCGAGRYIVAVCHDRVKTTKFFRETTGTLRLIDRETGNTLHVFDFEKDAPEEKRKLNGVVCSPDGRYVFSRDYKSLTLCWDLEAALAAAKKADKK